MTLSLPLAAYLSGEPLVNALITILVIVIILAIVWWLVDLIPSPSFPKQLIRILISVIAAVAAIVILLRLI